MNFLSSLESEQYGDSEHTLQTIGGKGGGGEEEGWGGGSYFVLFSPLLSVSLHTSLTLLPSTCLAE